MDIREAKHGAIFRKTIVTLANQDEHERFSFYAPHWSLAHYNYLGYTVDIPAESFPIEIIVTELALWRTAARLKGNGFSWDEQMERMILNYFARVPETSAQQI